MLHHRWIFPLVVMLAAPAAAAEGLIRSVGKGEVPGTAQAVVVDGSVVLAHTAQELPFEPGGALGHVAGDADAQAIAVLDRLDADLRQVNSNITRVVKLNVYAAKYDALLAFRKALAKRLEGIKTPPAISEVIGTLIHPDALVAADAVAAADRAVRDIRVAFLPPGGRVYVSGQADPGSNISEATRKTLAGLDDTLTFLGLDRANIVQVKAFMQPIAAADEVKRELAVYFQGIEPMPPLVLVEWTMPAPIEIELIVASPKVTEGQPVEYLTPPTLKPSPVFSRVARINRTPIIYLSGFHGPAKADGKEQVAAIFDAMGKVLKEAGSDFKHLVKATYYVSADDSSKALNDIRPKFYDPARPPAASKASVKAAGADGQTITLDMIAVEAR